MANYKSEGLHPAIVTPFHEGGTISYTDFERVVNYVTAHPVGAIVVNGHAGELLKQTRQERKDVVKAAVEFAAGRCPVVAGIHSEYVKEAADMAEDVQSVGASGILLLPPWHQFGGFTGVVGSPGALDPTGAHTEKFYKEVAKVGMPIIIFNYAEFSIAGYNMDTVKKLLDIKEVVGIKQPSQTPFLYQEAYKEIKAYRPEVGILAADDLMLYYGLVHGVDGALIGIGGIATDQWLLMMQEIKNGNYDAARQIHEKLTPLMIATHVPLLYHCVRMKIGLRKMGIIKSSAVRQPPYPREEDEIIMDKALRESGLMP
jgi:4-hydroxy-tetrahydrodipicolinate synthase